MDGSHMKKLCKYGGSGWFDPPPRRWVQVEDCSLCSSKGKKHSGSKSCFSLQESGSFCFSGESQTQSGSPSSSIRSVFYSERPCIEHALREGTGCLRALLRGNKAATLHGLHPGDSKVFLCSGGRLPGRRPKLNRPVPHQLGAILTVKAGASGGHSHSLRRIQRSTRSETRIVFPIYVD